MPQMAAEDILGPALVSGIGEALLQGMLLFELSAFRETPTNNRLLMFTVYWINAVAL